MVSKIYDVIVIGTGPAGITATNLLAAKGLDTLIVGPNVHQMLQLPETFYGVSYELLERLDIEKDIGKVFSVPKPIRLISVNDNFTYQIAIEPNVENFGRYGMSLNRAVFEQILIERTVERGATYLPMTVVEDFIFTDDQVTGVKCYTPDGNIEEYGAKVVIEASGNRKSLLSRLGSSREEKKQDKDIAVFAQYTEHSFSKIVSEHEILVIALDSGYLLAMPLPNKRINIMVALEGKKVSGDASNLDKIFQEAVNSWEPLAKLTQAAEKVTPTLPVKNQNWEYERFSGNRFLVIGDAVGFLDPFSCNGVAIGMNAGEIAADFVAEALNKGNGLIKGDQFSLYDQQIRNLLDKWKRVWGIANLSLSSMGLLKQSLRLLNQLQLMKLEDFKEVSKQNNLALAVKS